VTRSEFEKGWKVDIEGDFRRRGCKVVTCSEILKAGNVGRCTVVLNASFLLYYLKYGYLGVFTDCMARLVIVVRTYTFIVIMFKAVQEHTDYYSLGTVCVYIYMYIYIYIYIYIPSFRRGT
jgi:hypothetical protein